MKNKFIYLYLTVITILFLFLFIRENYHERIFVRFQHLLSDDSQYDKNTDERLLIYDLYSDNDHHSEILMFGNSITNGVYWNELLGMDVSNRGVAGDKTKGMLDRIDNILEERPKYVFFMGGINDIYQRVNEDEIFSNITIILNILDTNDIVPIVQSTLYVSSDEDNYLETNIKVKSLNKRVKSYCADKNILFLDINKLLSTDEQLIDQYTTDGVHLSAKGYKIWGDYLRKEIHILKQT